MKIVIVNQHTCNRGDEAAGRAVIESLLNEFPNSKIDVLYRYAGKYPPIWNNTDRVKHYTEIKHFFNKKFMLLYYVEIFFNLLLCIFKSSYFIGKSGEICKKINEADIVVNAPTGPDIGDIYRDKVSIINLLFSVLQRKPTFIYGSSVGPFKIFWLREISKFLFNKMTYICVREDVSLKSLQNLNLKNKNITSSIDAALQRKISNSNAEKLYEKAGFSLNKKNIGITPLAYLWYPNEVRNIKTQNKVEENLVKIIDEITKNGDTNVFFFPQLFHFEEYMKMGKSDMPIINSIITKVQKPEFCKVVPPEYDSDCQQSMISKLDYFIGMRYHSIIFSIKMRIPVIGICYEHKANGFLEKIGFSKLIINLKDFIDNESILTDKIIYIENNKNAIINNINKILPDLEFLSTKGTRLIKKCYENNFF